MIAEGFFEDRQFRHLKFLLSCFLDKAVDAVGLAGPVESQRGREVRIVDPFEFRLLDDLPARGGRL